jgi:Uma2 family endonuclease
MTTVAELGPCLETELAPMHRFSVAQYHRMIEADVFGPEERTELIEGLVVKKMVRLPPHDAALGRLNRRLSRLLSDEWVLRVQSAVTMRYSEPEPDVAVARGPEETYDNRHPGPKDLALVVEVAESSLDFDRRIKGPLYARNKIPAYWLVNLIDGRIEVYTDPKGGRSAGYRRRRDYDLDQSVPLVLGNRVVAHLAVRELLP